MTTYNPNPGVMDLLSNGFHAHEPKKTSSVSVEDEPEILVSSDMENGMFIPKISRDGGQTFSRLAIQASSPEKAMDVARESILASIRELSVDRFLFHVSCLFAVMSFGGVLFTMFFLMSSNLVGGVFLVMVIFMVVISQGISLDRARDTAKKREAVSRSIRYV